jgi:HD-GYP domain-containing protein (c-di-GMP phosphodiesterase class II)
MPKKFAIEDLQPGMKFSMPLYTDDNNVLLQANIPLKESDYKNFVRWGIKELLTDGDLVLEVNKPDDDDDRIQPDYITIYNECLDFFGQLSVSYQNNESLDKKKLEEIIDKLFDAVERYKNDLVSYIASNDSDYNYLITHAINTTIISLIGGIELKLSRERLTRLGMAGLLHDIGMMSIPDKILNKRGKLSDDEYKIVKTHPVTAFKSLNNMSKFNQDVLDAILQHHEQYDGKGYPRKLGGDKIHIYAKILAIADTFEALITNRSYRRGKTGYVAMKEVLAEAQNRFDPKVLRAFLTTLSIYPPGTLVQLNNNAIGSVVSVNPEAPLRPRVRIIVDEFGDKVSNYTVTNLVDTRNLFIVHVLNKEEYKSKKQ